MPVNRRDFLRAGAGVGALTLAPSSLRALGRRTRPPVVETTPITDPTVRELAFRAVEAARAAGASYADVRLTHTRRMINLEKTELLSVGVRALVAGYWGFTAGTIWTPDEVARLGGEAVALAQTNALGKRRVVDLGRVPVVKDGHWTMPVERDPFDVPEGEILDEVASLLIYTKRRWGNGNVVRTFAVTCERQDKAFASSEGSYCTQRLYRTAGTIVLDIDYRGDKRDMESPIVDGAGRGWEYITQAPLREEVDRRIEEMHEYLSLPPKPVEVGRYDVVFDAESMARIVDGTFGAATELDRAMGYEANAGGTSYLNDPSGMLGTYQAAAPAVTLTADRTTPGALATVKWDDEAVEPSRFELIRDGTLVDFQTTREAASWMPESRVRHGRPVHSHGCAVSSSAQDVPMLHRPNLALAPGREALDFDDLVRGMKSGLAVRQLGSFFFEFDMDFQCLNGYGRGWVYEIKDGKKVGRPGASFLFRAPEFWKGILVLGGVASQRRFAHRSRKGEPSQTTWHTVSAVPAVVKQVTTIDPTRKA